MSPSGPNKTLHGSRKTGPSRVDSSRARPRQTAGLNGRPAGTGKSEHGAGSATSQPCRDRSPSMRLQDGTVTFISTAPQPIMALTNTNPFREVMPGWRAMAAGKGRSHMGVCDCSAWRHGGGLEPCMVEGGLGSYKRRWRPPSLRLLLCLSHQQIQQPVLVTLFPLLASAPALIPGSTKPLFTFPL
jgi:hypothetical protein